MYYLRKGNEKDMKIGDLIKNKTRYVGQKFLVIGVRDTSAHGHQVRGIRMPDGFKTRWSLVNGWEVISESR